MASSICKCGWLVPKNVVLYSDKDKEAEIEYECPQCGQEHVIGVFDQKPQPEGEN